MKKTSCNKNIEQTQFHSCTVFLCSKFKLENIYSGVNLCGKNVHGNLFLPLTGKIAKIRTRKNFVLHSISNFNTIKF